MAIEDIIYSRMTTHAGTAALISTRCYPSQLPQGATIPAVTYQPISRPERDDVPGMFEQRVQFNCWAASVLAASALATQVRAAFTGWRDKNGTPVVIFTKAVNELTDLDPVTDYWRYIVDVQFQIIEE